MKFYRAIYCSSQKTVEGSYGFGFRTYTENMPKEYLNAIDSFHLINNGSCPSLDSSELHANRQLVLDIPIDYEFRKIPMEGGNNIFALIRKVEVGFDWPYYESFTPNRTGNYVVDYIVFESQVDIDCFNLLYEQEEAMAFIPRNIVPTDNNEELKKLEIGDYPLLKEQDYLKTKKDYKISSKYVSRVYWALLEAKFQGKPAIVKIKSNEAATLLADLYSLLPYDVIENTPFISDYQEEGMERGVELFMINEYYQYEIYPNQGVFIDLTQENHIKSKEQNLFSKEFDEWLKNSDRDSIKDFTTWILSEKYKRVRENAEELVMAVYAFKNHKTTIDDINKLDVLNVLLEYIGDSNDLKNQLVSIISNEFEQTLSENTFEKLVFQLKNISTSFPVDSIIEKYKKHVSTWLLETPERFVSMLKKLRYNDLSKYLDKTVCESKEHYLDNKLLIPFWVDIYEMFLSSKKKADKKSLAERIFKNELSTKDREKIIGEIYPYQQEQFEFYKNYIKDNPDKISIVWPYLELCLQTVKEEKLTLDYKNYWNNKDFSPIFLKEYKEGYYTDLINSIETILVPIIKSNESFAHQVVKGYKEDGIIPRVYENLKKKDFGEKDKRYDLVRIFYEIFKNVDDRWQWFECVVNKENVTTSNVKNVYELANELLEKEYLKTILPQYLNVLSKDEYALKITGKKDSLLTDYKDIVIDWAKNQKEKQYYLGFIVNKKQGISYADAQEQLKDLGFTEEEISLFCQEYYKGDCRKEKIKRYIENLFKSKNKKDNSSNIVMPQENDDKCEKHNLSPESTKQEGENIDSKSQCENATVDNDIAQEKKETRIDE